MAGTYASIVRDYQRRFKHEVRLRNAYVWRIAHINHRVRHLSREEFGDWHEGDQGRANYFGVWGFKCPAQAACLEGWAVDCGVDWSILPEDQTERPPPVPERSWTADLPPTVRHGENLHSVAGSAGLGVICTACNRRAMLTPVAIGAHSGNMREVSTLRLTCKACGSWEWQHQVLENDQHAAKFITGAS